MPYTETLDLELRDYDREDILNSLHYQLYAETLKADDVIIYYKASSEKPFQLLSSNDI